MKFSTIFSRIFAGGGGGKSRIFSTLPNLILCLAFSISLFGQPPLPSGNNIERENFGPTRVCADFSLSSRPSPNVKLYTPADFAFCAYSNMFISPGEGRGELVVDNRNNISLGCPYYLFWGQGIETADQQSPPTLQNCSQVTFPSGNFSVRFKRIGWTRITQNQNCINGPIRICDVFVSDASEVPTNVPNARASFSHTETGCPGSAYSLNLQATYNTAVARWNVKIIEVSGSGVPVVNGTWEKGWAGTDNNTMYQHTNISLANGTIGVNNQALNIQYGRIYKIEKTVDSGCGEETDFVYYVPGQLCRPTISTLTIPSSTLNGGVHEICQTTGSVLLLPTTTLPAGAPALLGYRVKVLVANNACQFTGAALPTTTFPVGTPIDLTTITGFLPNTQYFVSITPYNSFGEGFPVGRCIYVVSAANNAGFVYQGDEHSRDPNSQEIIDYECEDVACEGQELGRTNINLKFLQGQLDNVDYIELLVSEMDDRCKNEYPIIGELKTDKYSSSIVGPKVITRATLSSTSDIINLNREWVANYWTQAISWMPGTGPNHLIKGNYFQRYDVAYDPNIPSAQYVNGGYGLPTVDNRRFKVNIKFYGNCLFFEKTCYFRFNGDPLWKKGNKVANVELVEETGLSAEIYPNPTNGQTTLELFVPAKTDGIITITDLQGRVIQQINSTFVEGSNQLSLDVSEFAAGLYFYKVQTNSGQLSGKLQKQ